MDPKELLLHDLNPQQYEAATHMEGPALVVAGAGTGKTRVVEYRVLYLVSQGVDPRQILLLTFTRRAAREMLSRAARHDPLCGHVQGGTFHSFGYGVISRYAHLLGLGRPLSFLDEADRETLLHRLAVQLGYTQRKVRFPSKATLREVISASFNRGESVEEVLLRDYPHFLQWAQEIERLREAYLRYKVERNLLDYDDLLLYLKLLLLEEEPVRRALGERYRFIMVDEYQDTNRLQAEVVYLLGSVHRNVMAVGDDAQSIYTFRGARYQNMFDFLEVFPDAKVIKLEENYRSTQQILDLANAVMEGAKRRYTKVLRAKRGEGPRPRLLLFKDPESEAEGIAQRVKELWDEGVELGRIGVLFRSMYIARPLEVSLARRGIPYRTYGGLKFVETAHVKDLLCHVKVLVNPKDELAWHRVLTLIEGVGPRTAEAITRELFPSGDWRGAVAKREGHPRAGPGLKRLRETLDEAARLPFPEAVSLLCDYYIPLMEARYDDYPRRLGDIEALRVIAKGYRSAERFLLELVAIEPPEEGVLEREDQRLDTRPLTLSTIHSAKGLEWQVVFLMGVADGHLPISYSHLSEEELEEERRLLYVAITRAREELYLTMSHEGSRGGIGLFQRLSRFLDDPEILALLDVEGEEAPPEGGPVPGDLVERVLRS